MVYFDYYKFIHLWRFLGVGLITSQLDASKSCRVPVGNSKGAQRFERDDVIRP
jgi:hypothetical protein